MVGKRQLKTSTTMPRRLTDVTLLSTNSNSEHSSLALFLRSTSPACTVRCLLLCLPLHARSVTQVLFMPTQSRCRTDPPLKRLSE